MAGVYGDDEEAEDVVEVVEEVGMGGVVDDSGSTMAPVAPGSADCVGSSCGGNGDCVDDGGCIDDVPGGAEGCSGGLGGGGGETGDSRDGGSGVMAAVALNSCRLSEAGAADDEDVEAVDKDITHEALTLPAIRAAYPNGGSSRCGQVGCDQPSTLVVG